MHNRMIIGVSAVLLILSLAAGCGAKPASGGESSAKPSASASAEHSAAPAEKPTAHGETAASAKATVTPTPTPKPTPKPTPTETPLGTVVNGWIAGIPDYVPRFPSGHLDQTRSKILQGSISTAFTLTFTGVAQADVDAYAALLQKKGYKAGAAQIGDLYTLTASLQLAYGTVTIVITLDASGTASYALEAPV